MTNARKLLLLFYVLCGKRLCLLWNGLQANKRAFQAFNSLIKSTKHGQKEREGIEGEFDDTLPCQARRSWRCGLLLPLVIHNWMHSKV